MENTKELPVVFTENMQRPNEIVKEIIHDNLIQFSDTFKLNLSTISIANLTVAIYGNYNIFRSRLKILYMSTPSSPSDIVKLNRYKLSSCLVAAVIINLPFGYYKEIVDSIKRPTGFYYYNELFAFIIGFALLKSFFIDSLPMYPPEAKEEITRKILKDFPSPFISDEEFTATILVSLSTYTKEAYEIKRSGLDTNEFRFDFMAYAIIFEHLEEKFTDIQRSLCIKQK